MDSLQLSVHECRSKRRRYSFPERRMRHAIFLSAVLSHPVEVLSLQRRDSREAAFREITKVWRDVWIKFIVPCIVIQATVNRVHGEGVNNILRKITGFRNGPSGERLLWAVFSLTAKRLTHAVPYPLTDGRPLDAELCSFPPFTVVSTLLR